MIINYSGFRNANQAGFRALKPEIDKTYLTGRVVAIQGHKIIADAGSFAELDQMLGSLGIGPDDALVCQSGEELLDFADILCRGAKVCQLPLMDSETPIEAFLSARG